MSVVLKIPTPLRTVTGGIDSIEADSDVLSGALSILNERFPGIEERLFNDNGELHRFVNIYVNGEDVRFLDGLSTKLSSGDEVSIVPAVAGG
jgi:molybdopterin synthase sulfur carrier subunit